MRNWIVSAIRWLVVKAGLWADVLQEMQCECIHPSKHIVADILEGDYQGSQMFGFSSPTGVQVKWCRLCGAYRVETKYNWAWVGQWTERVPHGGRPPLRTGRALQTLISSTGLQRPRIDSYHG